VRSTMREDMGKRPLAAVWGAALSEANQSLPLRHLRSAQMVVGPRSGPAEAERMQGRDENEV